MFKKPKKRNSFVKKRVWLEEDNELTSTKRKREDDEDGEDSSKSSALTPKEIAILARQRAQRAKRSKGLLIAGYSDQDRESQDQRREIDSELEGQFTQETHVSEVEKLMENYVEEKMKEKIRNDDEDEGYGLLSHEAALEKKKKEEEKLLMQNLTPLEIEQAKRDAELYKVPDHLLPESLKQAKVREDDPMGAMASGIVEVELPAEYKLKNIEETEKAKQELKRKKQEEAEIRKAKPAFHRFRPQYQIGQSRPEMATDDLAYDRFKRSQVHRNR